MMARIILALRSVVTCDLFAFICYLKDNLTKKKEKLVKLLETGGQFTSPSCEMDNRSNRLCRLDNVVLAVRHITLFYRNHMIIDTQLLPLIAALKKYGPNSEFFGMHWMLLDLMWYTYLIGYYNPSIRITTQLLTSLMLCLLILYMTGRIYSLKSIPYDKFLRNF